MILALTGHRPNKLNNEYDGKGPMSKWILRELTDLLIELKPTEVISGMALGADMLWAEAAINLNIPFTAAIPFAGQENKWPQVYKDRYSSVLARATKLVIITEGDFASWKMQKRNEWMVDHCNYLVAVWDGSSGGTSNCIRYASSQHKPVIFINPNPSL